MAGARRDLNRGRRSSKAGIYKPIFVELHVVGQPCPKGRGLFNRYQFMLLPQFVPSAQFMLLR